MCCLNFLLKTATEVTPLRLLGNLFQWSLPWKDIVFSPSNLVFILTGCKFFVLCHIDEPVCFYETCRL